MSYPKQASGVPCSTSWRGSRANQQGDSVKKEAVHKHDENFWNVQSASNKQTVHHVRRISSSCSCLFNCPSCDAWVHTFECPCADYSIKGVLCSHIHSVNILYPKTTAADLEFPGTELETTSDSDIEEKREELSNIIQQDKQLHESKQLADLKTYAPDQIAELSELIQSAPTNDTINTTLKHIRSAISVAKGLSVIGSDHQYLKTQLFPPNKLYEAKALLLYKEKKESSSREG